jgi:hypothetical protein
MRTTIAFTLTLAFAGLVAGALLGAGCALDHQGLEELAQVAEVDAGPIKPPSAHPDAGAPPGPEAGEASEAGATSLDALPETSPRGSIRSCAQAASPGACEGCQTGGTDLSALCRAALACLLTDPPYEFTPVVGAGPDPIGYCASSQNVAACVRAALCPDAG